MSNRMAKSEPATEWHGLSIDVDRALDAAAEMVGRANKDPRPHMMTSDIQPAPWRNGKSAVPGACGQWYSTGGESDQNAWRVRQLARLGVIPMADQAVINAFAKGSQRGGAAGDGMHCPNNATLPSSDYFNALLQQVRGA